MREDIVGMLKNAIEHGGNPARVSQSLINSGYPQAEVQQALSYVVANLPQEKQAASSAPIQTPAQSQIQQSSMQIKMPQAPQYQQPKTQPPFKSPFIPQPPVKPLPSVRHNSGGVAKLIIMVFILLILIGSLISVIIFKDKILNLIS